MRPVIARLHDQAAIVRRYRNHHTNRSQLMPASPELEAAAEAARERGVDEAVIRAFAAGDLNLALARFNDQMVRLVREHIDTNP